MMRLHISHSKDPILNVAKQSSGSTKLSHHLQVFHEVGKFWEVSPEQYSFVMLLHSVHW